MKPEPLTRVEIDSWLRLLGKSKTMENLKCIFGHAYRLAKENNDEAALEEFKKCKDEQKSKLVL